jgi:hypothetical protein
VGRPIQLGYGLTCATIGHLVAAHRRQRSITTLVTGVASIRSLTCGAGPASSRQLDGSKSPGAWRPDLIHCPRG